MNKILAFFAFLVLAAFLSILVIKVPRFDLAIVIAFTIVLAAWDFYTTHKHNKK